MDGSEKQGVLEIGGHAFKRVKAGLDEAQVAAAVQSLVDEKEELAKRQGHFTSLMKLAEKMIADADVLAEQIKSEAKVKAESDVQALTARVEEDARRQAEAVLAEAVDRANRESGAIREAAQRGMQESLMGQAERLKAELSQSASGVCQRMLAQAEALKQEALELQQEFAAGIARLDVDMTAPSDAPGIVPALTVAAAMPAAAAVLAAEPVEAPVAASEDVPPDGPRVEGAGDGRYLEIEILPPRDTAKIRSIETFLKNAREVDTQELENFVDRTLIRVLLRENADLRQKLAGHPAVKEAVEVIEKGQRKLRLTLNVKSELDESRDSLSRDIGRILTRK